MRVFPAAVDVFLKSYVDGILFFAFEAISSPSNIGPTVYSKVLVSSPKLFIIVV